MTPNTTEVLYISYPPLLTKSYFQYSPASLTTIFFDRSADILQSKTERGPVRPEPGLKNRSLVGQQCEKKGLGPCDSLSDGNLPRFYTGQSIRDKNVSSLVDSTPRNLLLRQADNLGFHLALLCQVLSPTYNQQESLALLLLSSTHGTLAIHQTRSFRH